MPLPCVQDTALEVETEVAARVLGLETEHKLKLSLLQTELKEEIDVLKLENRNLHEKLQHEIHLREDLERVSVALAASMLADSSGDPCGSWHSSPCYLQLCLLRAESGQGSILSRARVWVPVASSPASRIRGLAGCPQVGGRLVGAASCRPCVPWCPQWC